MQENSISNSEGTVPPQATEELEVLYRLHFHHDQYQLKADELSEEQRRFIEIIQDHWERLYNAERDAIGIVFPLRNPGEETARELLMLEIVTLGILSINSAEVYATQSGDKTEPLQDF